MAIQKDIGYPNGDPGNGAGSVELRGQTFRLRPEAAGALAAWAVAYRQRFGADLPVNEALRDLATQRRYRQLYLEGRGALAGIPGTSIHGWGLAIDVDIYSDEQHAWLVETAPAYGWWWAGATFSEVESWHFEFDGRGLTDAQLAAYATAGLGGDQPLPIPPEEDDMFRARITDEGELHDRVYLVTSNGHAWIDGPTSEALDRLGARPVQELDFARFWALISSVDTLNRQGSALTADDDLARLASARGLAA